ncbi:glucose-6-phosphate dehydrogenase [Pectinatus cerevisiiphilus]|uniref:glucose-6-phosphate dehydrogenase n=1 Tax=Pectinatus cerevisiiphilus TaxID=86956 RepID=UPI0018C82FEF|nr:glucose-6-phosphate dehydrogenase [Pectinatus cerevisiiphilus]
MSESAFTIFGGTGDLTFRKLLPALYNMSASNDSAADRQIIIIGRRNYSTETYCAKAREWVKQFSRLPYTDEDFKVFSKRISYYKMDFTDIATYTSLNAYYQKRHLTEHIFYFAVAPRFFSIIADGLTNVANACHGKVILEKPFGEDLDSAKVLNIQLETFFNAKNIFRIDHYLGKEMIRNIQTLRFSNPIFSNLWNSRYIESVQISAFEDIGIEGRGGYYDASGALRDMVQNHLFQILSIVAMEWPEKFSTDAMHDAQIRVLRALRPVIDVRESLVLGQYEGYHQEKLVKPQSKTETYAALRLFIDNERWWNTPFYIRTGKKLDRREIKIAIIFRPAFLEKAAQNILIIKIQPSEGVYLQFNIKKPGDTDEIIQAKMDFCQNNYVNKLNTPEAYERLIKACINNNKSWFSQWDQIELSWNYIDKLHELYDWEKLPLFRYKAGTTGPQQANELLRRFGHKWID